MSAKQKNLRTLQGVVASDKMMKTCVVVITRKVKHDTYKKYITKTTRLKAHNEMGAKQGDIVIVAESRPISKEKAWVVKEIINKAVVADD